MHQLFEDFFSTKKRMEIADNWSMGTRAMAIARVKLSRVCNLQAAISILVSTQVGTGRKVPALQKKCKMIRE